MLLGGTSLVTTLPAPTIAFSPMVTLARMVHPEPIEAPFLTNVRSTFQSASVCRPPSCRRPRVEVVDERHAVADEHVVFDVTPSQMNVWLEILQRLPILAFF